MKKSEKTLGILAAIVALFLFVRGRSIGNPPEPPGGVEPPTIPTLSSYRLSRVTFDCDDVGITSLNNWKVLIGVRPHTLDPHIRLHILVKDPAGIEKAHLMTDTLMPQDSNHYYKTITMQNDTISGLTACTVYTAFCWVTDIAETVSYFPLQSGGWRTRGCA